ncbi:hypothetical protein [Trueperella pyogenes]
MILHSYSVDGISLHSPGQGWALEAATQLAPGVSRDTTIVTAPFMDGAEGVRGGYGLGKVSVSVAVHVEDLERDGLQRSVSRLVALLADARNIVCHDAGIDLKKTVIRSTVSDPVMLSPWDAKVHAIFDVAPFWVEGVPRVGRGVPLRVGRVRLPEFDDATGKIVDAVIRLTGPFSMVELADHHGGGLIVGGAERGESIFVDLHAWRSWKTRDPEAWEKPKETGFPEFPAGGRLELVPLFTGQMVTTSLEVKRATGVDKHSLLTVRGSRWWM